MKKMLYSFWLKGKNLLCSFKEWRQIHLMDEVIYQDRRCFVNNGTRYNEHGEHLWDIVECEENENGRHNVYYIRECEIYRVFSWRNIKNALFSRYNWWKKYWYKIDLDKLVLNSERSK